MGDLIKSVNNSNIILKKLTLNLTKHNKIKFISIYILLNIIIYS